MKGLRKIVIKLFFLLMVSLCVGINTYSTYNIHHSDNELLTYIDNAENGFSTNTDNMIDDQIDQSANSALSPEAFSLIPLSQVCYPINILCFSIWQPPKIS